MSQHNAYPTDQSSYLDAKVKADIEEMMDGDNELIIDLIDTMLDSTPDLMSQLKAGIQQQHASQIRDAAHALKSSSAQMGALPFSALCKNMEQLGREEQLAEATRAYPPIEAGYQQMVTALEGWKTSLAG